MADPDFVSVPEAGLLSRTTRRGGARRWSWPTPPRARAPGNPFAFQGPAPAPRSPARGDTPRRRGAGVPNKETTHITTSDAAGNIVALHVHHRERGRQRHRRPRLWLPAQQRADGLRHAADPAAPHPNVPEPGKRPRSSMSPTLVFKDGGPCSRSAARGEHHHHHRAADAREPPGFRHAAAGGRGGARASPSATRRMTPARPSPSSSPRPKPPRSRRRARVHDTRGRLARHGHPLQRRWHRHRRCRASAPWRRQRHGRRRNW